MFGLNINYRINILSLKGNESDILCNCSVTVVYIVHLIII